MYVCVERAQEDKGYPKFLCMIPACWPMLCVTLGLIVGISCAAYASSFPFVEPWLRVLAIVSLLINVASLLITAFSDPGIQPRRDAPGLVSEDGWIWNEAAESFRQHGTVLCNESGVLVKDIDHFCPWTGTTIAGGNLRPFYAFVGTLWINLFFVLGLFIAGRQAALVNVLEVDGNYSKAS